LFRQRGHFPYHASGSPPELALRLERGRGKGIWADGVGQEAHQEGKYLKVPEILNLRDLSLWGLSLRDL